MSAHIVDPSHIDAMLSVAINGPAESATRVRWIAPYVDELFPEFSGSLSRVSATPTGRILLAACIASVSEVHDEPPGALPGPDPNPDPGQYEWTDLGQLLTAIECCKAISHFEFQSCAHPGWADSGARAFCGRLRDALIPCIEDYEDAPGHWSTERVVGRAAAQGRPGFR
jgi:hypothetical protein